MLSSKTILQDACTFYTCSNNSKNLNFFFNSLIITKYYNLRSIQHQGCIYIFTYAGNTIQYLKIFSFFKFHFNLRGDCLIDIKVSDFVKKEKRFEITYILFSYKYNLRYFLITYIKDFYALHTACNLWQSSNWIEREIWDMFGIFFFNHKDLRKILTDYGFESFPLRKDFPVVGFFESRYDDTKKRIISEPLELNQEFRNFFFVNPWNLFYKYSLKL